MTPVQEAWTRLSTWMADYERPVGAPMPGVIPSTLAADRAVVEEAMQRVEQGVKNVAWWREELERPRGGARGMSEVCWCCTWNEKDYGRDLCDPKTKCKHCERCADHCRCPRPR